MNCWAFSALLLSMVVAGEGLLSRVLLAESGREGEEAEEGRTSTVLLLPLLLLLLLLTVTALVRTDKGLKNENSFI